MVLYLIWPVFEDFSNVTERINQRERERETETERDRERQREGERDHDSYLQHYLTQ